MADSASIVVLTDMPAGLQTFAISHIGYASKEIGYTLPLGTSNAVEIKLEEKESEEEVIVTATRTSRTITNTPTRTEVISGEELAEKGNMKPGDIRMLLNESTGIQTQQTSATSFNAGIRIQGLEGRYTQLLRDGYPLYAGFSGGLSILQIAPLDLRQVEVVKGAASTLYGAGAIAGLVNLVSKTPAEEKELSLVANATTAKGLDLSAFYSQRYGGSGLTVFASRNSNGPFDAANMGLTAIPKFERYTFNPRLFLYGESTTADIGASYIKEDRIGGNIDYIKRGGGGFFEKNNTDRITVQAGIRHQLDSKNSVQLKNSYSRLDRTLAIPAHLFGAIQQSSFSELTLNTQGNAMDWVMGINVLTEDLSEKNKSAGFTALDYHFNTYGAFLQNTWAPSSIFTLESGLRVDYINEYGFEFLPRISALLRISPKLTTRLGGGAGYKTPTPFTEEAERLQFQNILPIDKNSTENERSLGGNWDINYRTKLGDVGLTFNHLFFYTRLNSPLILQPSAGSMLAFKNANGHIDTKGMETNLKFLYGDFKLFIGYTYTDAETHFDSDKLRLPLTAKHRLNNVLMYEIEEKLKLGLEGYFFSRQKLTDGSYGKPYWITGFMAEKLWEKFSLYINFENFTDTRQSKFGPIYRGSIDNPHFNDIYAPVEGFVVNGGIKLRL